MTDDEQEQLYDTFAKAAAWSLLVMARKYEKHDPRIAEAIKECADHIAMQLPPLDFAPST